jgi:flagellar biogenesis protein FliO
MTFPGKTETTGAGIRASLVFWLALLAQQARADATNAVSLPTSLPEVGVSAVRALAALAFVLALFFAGVWLFRNGQRFAWKRAGAPRLAVLESRALGARQTLHVIGYDKQRLLIGSSPSGLCLLAALPPENTVPTEAVDSSQPAPPSFATQLQELIRGGARSANGGGNKV